MSTEIALIFIPVWVERERLERLSVHQLTNRSTQPPVIASIRGFKQAKDHRRLTAGMNYVAMQQSRI